MVHIDFTTLKEQADFTEFQELAISAGVDPVALITTTRPAPDPKYFVGSGKAEEIRLNVALHHAEIVLFNHSLSPSQERNLEKLVKCRVLDRTGLILDIFAQRARSFEGKLQVELAQLRHLSTRLVRGWTHLERQKGGIGLRGPGETQLETDRRLLRNRIQYITKRLEKVRSQRDQGRRARQRAELPIVSLVGYTNAGKSSLFNRLTQADIYTANQLFATLDTTLRRSKLPELNEVVLADTVGFIQQLPHDLIEAFRATLEETREANLLLHVIDASHPERHFYIDAVNAVLREIGADKVQQLQVYNKIDLIKDRHPRIDRNEQNKPWRVWVSAITGEGIDLLCQAIKELIIERPLECCILLTPEDAKLRGLIYQLGNVISEEIDAAGNWRLHVRLQQNNYERLFS